MTVTELTPFATNAVYDVVAELNDGLNIPLEIVNEDNVASLLNVGVVGDALVIVIVYVLVVPS